MRDLAPIVIFTYNRPEHLEKCLKSLSSCVQYKQSKKYIFCDGLKKTEKKDIKKRIDDVILKYQDNNTVVKKRKINLGLSQSIITGINEVFKKSHKIIVVEDDLIFSKYFIEFMNKSLITYNYDKKVCSISGYTIKTNRNLPELFFLNFINSWGWATWKRSWNIFEPNAKKLAQEIAQKKYINKFNLDSSYPFYRMIKKNIIGENDSWAIRWYASIFLNNMLTLYSSKTLVKNIGMDKNATNTKKKIDQQNLSKSKIKISKIDITEDKYSRKIYSNYHKLLSVKLILKNIFKFL